MRKKNKGIPVCIDSDLNTDMICQKIGPYFKGAVVEVPRGYIFLCSKAGHFFNPTSEASKMLISDIGVEIFVINQDLLQQEIKIAVVVDNVKCRLRDNSVLQPLQPKSVIFRLAVKLDVINAERFAKGFSDKVPMCHNYGIGEEFKTGFRSFIIETFKPGICEYIASGAFGEIELPIFAGQMADKFLTLDSNDNYISRSRSKSVLAEYGLDVVSLKLVEIAIEDTLNVKNKENKIYD